MYRNIFLNNFGLIINESELIKEMANQGLITHGGLFENSSFYRSVLTTEKGLSYFSENIAVVEMPNDIPESLKSKLKTYLGTN
jgi:hypothetical protein